MGSGESGYHATFVKRRIPEGSFVPRANRSHPGPNGDESDLATVLSTYDRRRDWNGYELLLWAALDDALSVLARAGTMEHWERLPAAQRLVAYETKQWIESEDASHIYAFVSICDYFGLEPEVVRRGAWRLTPEVTARSRSADVGRTKVGAGRQRWWNK